MFSKRATPAPKPPDALRRTVAVGFAAAVITAAVLVVTPPAGAFVALALVTVSVWSRTQRSPSFTAVAAATAGVLVVVVAYAVLAALGV